MKEKSRPILCGIDFSAVSVEAMEVAAAMARRCGTKLVLLHVEEYSGMAEVDTRIFEDALAQAWSDLEKEAARLRALGTEVEIKLLSGSVFDELVTATVGCEGRIMVLGAVGHGLALRLLIGSVAERTAETSSIPTLVVRPGSRLGTWLRGEHSLRILVGCDFSAASDSALRWVRELQQIGPCETTVLHVDWPPDEAERLGYRGPMSLTKNPAEIQNVLERDLAEHVALHLSGDNVTVIVEPTWGYPAGHFFEVIEREKIDLVILGTHHRHAWSQLRFGSVSRSILHHAKVSVAVVPSFEDQAPRSMPKLERVLAATDFSTLGDSAIPYAASILRRGGTLKILHVVHPSGAAGKNPPRAEKENRELLAQLRSLVPADARHRYAIEPEIIESDDAAEAIRQAAERFNADLICLGSHGRSGLAKTFLGSIAQGVMAGSRRPVLIVREERL